MRIHSHRVSCGNDKQYVQMYFLSAKSNSDVMVCLLSYKELINDISHVYLSYPLDRINTQVVYRFALAQLECTSYFLLSHCHS